MATIEEINAETARQKAELAKKKAEKKALSKAQRRQKSAKRKTEKETARVVLRQSGYTRPVILLNERTGEISKANVITFEDRRMTPTQYREYEVRKDGRCTSAGVSRASARVQAYNGCDLAADARYTSARVFPANPTPRQLSSWERNHDRYDIRGIDDVTAKPRSAPKKKKTATKPKTATRSAPRKTGQQTLYNKKCTGCANCKGRCSK